MQEGDFGTAISSPSDPICSSRMLQRDALVFNRFRGASSDDSGRERLRHQVSLYGNFGALDPNVPAVRCTSRQHGRLEDVLEDISADLRLLLEEDMSDDEKPERSRENSNFLTLKSRDRVLVTVGICNLLRISLISLSMPTSERACRHDQQSLREELERALPLFLDVRHHICRPLEVLALTIVERPSRVTTLATGLLLLSGTVCPESLELRVRGPARPHS